MSIQTDIERWDGKVVSELVKTYQNYYQQPAFLSDVVALLSVEHCQTGASWLLKHYVDEGGVISPDATSSILDNLPNLLTWESKLHVLQSLPHIPLIAGKKEVLEQFLRNQLVSKNKFVRAWAYNGFYLLAKQYHAYQAEALQFFEMAMRDESASVKARIRNLIKQGF